MYYRKVQTSVYFILLHSTHNTVWYEATNTCTYNHPGCV